MAPVRAAKKSHQNASRSSSTTASSAKAAKKTDVFWLADDQLVANAQGWGVYECVDMKTLKIFFEIMSYGDRFENDYVAREFVNLLSIKGSDTVATRALRLVMASKVGTPRKKK